MGAQPIDPLLIEQLYGTALHEDDWAPALQRCLTLFNTADMALAVSGPHGGVLKHETTGGVIDDEGRRQYADYFNVIDPKRPYFASAGPGFLFNDARCFDESFVAANGFYQEFTLPLGARHTLDLLAADVGGCEVYVAAMRNARQGPFQAADERLIRAIGPHFVRAYTLGLRLRTAASAAAAAGGALDALSFGVIVLDETGQAAVVNAAATRALAAGELRLGQGRLTARAPAVDRELQGALQRSLGDPLAPPAVLRAPRAEGGDWIVWVMRLPASSAFAAGETPGVLVLIGDPRRPGEIGREAVAGLFGLTEAEADLALALARGRSLAEIAAERGVKLSTVRSQLLAVLDKTGVHRQAELVRLLTTLPGAHLDGRQG
jgi:DNA-binding CsgD family transcriptional regulator